MARLVALGCSYTYGDGFEDCVSSTSSPPSVFAWPKLVSDQLGIECVNRSKSGIGNIEILHRLLTTELLETDIVVIMWSHFSRDVKFTENGGVEKYDLTSPLMEHWVKLHATPGDHDFNIRSWFNIHHANCYLKSRNIKCVNTFYPEFAYHDGKIRKPAFIDFVLHLTNWKVLDSNSGAHPHPGKQSQQYVANELIKIINNLNPNK